MGDFDLGIGNIVGAIGSLIGGAADRQQRKQEAANNIQLQKDFAQMGIQWKVEDARRAGINPLVALGASTSSFSPVSVGDSGMASSLSQMGQGVGRAAEAAMSAEDREAARKLRAETIRKAGLENELLSTQIQQAKNPPMPTGGLQTNQAQKTEPLIGPFGIKIPRGEGMDAQSWEDWAGQVGELIGGAGNMIESGKLALDNLDAYMFNKAKNLDSRYRSLVKRYLSGIIEQLRRRFSGATQPGG